MKLTQRKVTETFKDSFKHKLKDIIIWSEISLQKKSPKNIEDLHFISCQINSFELNINFHPFHSVYRPTMWLINYLHLFICSSSQIDHSPNGKWLNHEWNMFVLRIDSLFPFLPPSNQIHQWMNEHFQFCFRQPNIHRREAQKHCCVRCQSVGG